MVDTLCVILGGGRGTRLYPLTKERSKPAVPLAGKFRLIDMPISNCLNSGLNRIYVLTQFNSESLNKHVARTFKLDRFSKGFVEIMAPEQSQESMDWFQGTADAVRQCLKHFENPMIKRILILSGDQLYKFNFNDLINFHIAKRSEITIACNPIKKHEVSHFGIMGMDAEGRINRFLEKPQDNSRISDMAVSIDNKDRYLASMGIYVFEKNTLIELLKSSKKVDFGKEIIPEAFKTKASFAFIFKGYWKDIGTMKSFFDENLKLTNALPELDIYDEHWPFFTRSRNLPPSKIADSSIDHSVVADGCVIDKAMIKHTVLGIRSRVGQGSKIEDSVILGCDYYESIDTIKHNQANGVPSMGIGKNCDIKRAIIDKNARIGDNVKLINSKKAKHMEKDGIYIKDNIIVVTKNALLKSGTVI